MKIVYLRDASRYLGNAVPARITHRGENQARFEGRFDIVDHLKALRRRA